MHQLISMMAVNIAVACDGIFTHDIVIIRFLNADNALRLGEQFGCRANVFIPDAAGIADAGFQEQFAGVDAIPCVWKREQKRRRICQRKDAVFRQRINKNSRGVAVVGRFENRT